MSIDLKQVEADFKKDEGVWVDYPEDDDVKLKIRPLYPDKANELARKATKKTRNGKELNAEKLLKLTLEYVIEDFKGIEINGNIECTSEALILIAQYCDGIVKFVTQKSSEIADVIALQQGELLGN